jgi:hypothetical protein
VKKPPELTKEQWAKYKSNLELALGVMNKSLDLVADINFQAGELVERERIIKLVQKKYNYLIHAYGIAIVKEQLDLLLELIDAIKGEQK